jgi:hypothetical protein
VEEIKYPILLIFSSAFFVAMKLSYPDMLASSRLECGSKILRHPGYFISSTALSRSLKKLRNVKVGFYNDTIFNMKLSVIYMNRQIKAMEVFGFSKSGL